MGSLLVFSQMSRISGVGTSGGVYAILGYFYASGSLDHLNFKLIFDIYDKLPFTLQTFGNFVVPVEALIGLMQAARVINWPIGHAAHVLGFLYGIMIYQTYEEAWRPGSTQLKLKSLTQI